MQFNYKLQYMINLLNFIIIILKLNMTTIISYWLSIFYFYACIKIKLKFIIAQGIVNQTVRTKTTGILLQSWLIMPSTTLTKCLIERMGRNFNREKKLYSCLVHKRREILKINLLLYICNFKFQNISKNIFDISIKMF